MQALLARVPGRPDPLPGLRQLEAARMMGFWLFAVQAALAGVQTALTVWQPSPVTIGMCVFVGLLTVRTLLMEARS